MRHHMDDYDPKFESHELFEFLEQNGWHRVDYFPPEPSKCGARGMQTWHYGHSEIELYIHADGDVDLWRCGDVFTCRLRVLRCMLKRWGYAK